MKVLTVNISDTSGGAARAAFRIHQAVRALGVDSTMFVKDKQSDNATVLQVSDFGTPNWMKNSYRFVQNKLKNKIQQYRWSKYPIRNDVFLSDLRSSSIHGAFQKIDFDVLHLHWINLRFLDLKELVKLNKPIVWTLHDAWAFTGICHYFYDCEKYKTSCGACPHLNSTNEKDLSYQVWKKKQAYYRDLNLHIVSPSNWLGQAAKESSLLAQFPVHIIPNPIDTKLFTVSNKERVRIDLGFQKEKKYILYGAMNAVKDKNKGFQHLMNAIKHLEVNYEHSNIELLIFGADKSSTPIETKIPIRYYGYIRSDSIMVQLYQAADVMVVPSLSENLSNAIMESLSCGTPVVAFDIGGNSDMIEHKLNGYLAENVSSKELADGITWCLENNEIANLSINARNKVLENFTEDKVGMMYKRVYEGVVNKQ